MRDLDGDKELRGRSSESRLSNGGCLGFALDYGSYHVSGIREREKGRGNARGGTAWNCGNEVDGIEIVGIVIMPSGMR